MTLIYSSAESSSSQLPPLSSLLVRSDGDESGGVEPGGLSDRAARRGRAAEAPSLAGWVPRATPSRVLAGTRSGAGMPTRERPVHARGGPRLGQGARHQAPASQHARGARAQGKKKASRVVAREAFRTCVGELVGLQVVLALRDTREQLLRKS